MVSGIMLIVSTGGSMHDVRGHQLCNQITCIKMVTPSPLLELGHHLGWLRFSLFTHTMGMISLLRKIKYISKCTPQCLDRTNAQYLLLITVTGIQ